MTDDLDFVWTVTTDEGTVYCIPVTEREFLKFGPDDSQHDFFRLGIVSCDKPETILGNPVPIDLGNYRSRLQDAYAKFTEFDKRYDIGSHEVKDTELDVMAEIYTLCTEIIKPVHTSMGHD